MSQKSQPALPPAHLAALVVSSLHRQPDTGAGASLWLGQWKTGHTAPSRAQAGSFLGESGRTADIVAILQMEAPRPAEPAESGCVLAPPREALAALVLDLLPGLRPVCHYTALGVWTKDPSVPMCSYFTVMARQPARLVRCTRVQSVDKPRSCKCGLVATFELQGVGALTLAGINMETKQPMRRRTAAALVDEIAHHKMSRRLQQLRRTGTDRRRRSPHRCFMFGDLNCRLGVHRLGFSPGSQRSAGSLVPGSPEHVREGELSVKATQMIAHEMAEDPRQLHALENLPAVVPELFMDHFEFCEPFRYAKGAKQTHEMLWPSYKTTPGSLLARKTRYCQPFGGSPSKQFVDEIWRCYFCNQVTPGEMANQRSVRPDEETMQLGWLDKFGWEKRTQGQFEIIEHDDCPDLLLSDHVPMRFLARLNPY